MFLRSPPEKTLWKWFQQNEETLFRLDEAHPEPVFRELSAALAKVHDDLVFEISAVQNGKREFVISAGGIKEVFPAVKSLAAAAPPLERWTVTAFRPRHPLGDLAVNVDGVDVRAEQTEVALFPDGRKVGLSVFIPHVQDEKALAQVGFLLLDAALGEFDVTTKAGAIDFLPFDEQPDAPRLPLSQLPQAFDRAWEELAGR